MRDEIIKKNLIITITSLLLFFFFSFFATNYSIRSTFEKEVLSVSQMVENQLESENSNDVDVINNFTYNQTWLKIVYATNTGLIIVDSDDDDITGVNRIDDEKLNLLNNVEQKDRIYIVDNIIYYITSLENGNILITGIEFASVVNFIYQGVFFMLLIVSIVVVANIFLTRKTSEKIISAFSSINSHLKMINEGKFEEIDTKHDYNEVSDVLQEISLVYQNIYDYILQNKKEKDKIKFIIKNMNQGIIIVDEKHNIEIINDYAKRALSNTQEDKYYINIDELVSSTVIEKVQECFDKKKSCFFDLADSNKEKIYTYTMSYQTYKQENETNRTPLVIIVITDVTNERNNDKLKQEFIANASHELKTPITSITGFSEILLMNEVNYDDLTKKYLKIINKESVRMTSIINDMLYLANLQEKEKLPIEIEEIDLEELISSVTSEFERAIQKHNISIINSVSNVYIENNYDMLKHIVSNIIENAIKYNKENGKIYISCKERKNTIKLIIEDTGVGMESKNVDKIFNRFYREDESHNRKKSGSGLGLNIVKQISEIINAKITVESEIDKGSKFIITLNKKG
jgi:two-component system phosphate regulon sensor histidine kinase PhoR